MNNYLNLYVNSIKLNDKVKYHLDRTSILLDTYLSSILAFNGGEKYYLCKEDRYLDVSLGYPNIRKRGDCDPPEKLNDESLLRIHRYIMEREQNSEKIVESEIRKTPIGVYQGDKLLYRAPKPEEVDSLLEEFFDIYNNIDETEFSNPLIAGSLMHLLLVRIHPFRDGNGRSSRLLQELKFTESINKYYGTKLNLTPLDITEDRRVIKYQYSKKLNQISFSLDNNTTINEWLDFNIGLYEKK